MPARNLAPPVASPATSMTNASKGQRRCRRQRRDRGRRLCILFAPVVAALTQGSGERQASAQDLRYSGPVDVAITSGGLGAWIASEDLRVELVPRHCRWCDRDTSGDDTLNALDREVRRLRWRRTDAADTLSSAIAFVATPLAAGGFSAVAAMHDGRSRDVGTNVLLVSEVGALAADLNQLVKFVVVRERPDAHALALSGSNAHLTSVDDNLSFYSGHASEAVSLAVAAGTVASLRGYRLAPLVWGTSLPLALGAGYLRLAADRHYCTDVIVGVVVGVALGALVPVLFHSPEPGPLSAPGRSTSQAYVVGYSGVL